MNLDQNDAIKYAGRRRELVQETAMHALIDYNRQKIIKAKYLAVCIRAALTEQAEGMH